jgi:hypothetical protein
MPKGFERWPQGLGAGFSFKAGKLRGELHPAVGEDKLTQWVGYLWVDGTGLDQRVAEVWADNHWLAAVRLAAVAQEMAA